MPKQVLIMGAGKSATTLIEYILSYANEENWEVTVADLNVELALKKTGNHPNSKAIALDFSDEKACGEAVFNADCVISMLPPFMHSAIAKHCINYRKNLVTASYVSDEMKALDEAAKKAGILLLNEMGVDPGIDHMTAMEVLDDLRSKGLIVTGFESFTGGLMAPESEKGPWKYKFTWNPRNIVLAASGGAVKFLHGGRYKYIPYHKVFRRTEIIPIGNYGEFEAYGNRDSLKYKELYGLNEANTIYRGTLRRPGFCRAWDIFVQLGATDDTYLMDNVSEMTHREFINSFLYFHPTDSVEIKLAHALRMDLDSEEIRRVKWLGMFDDTPVGLNKPTSPAGILQHILEKKWTLEPGEKDMIVMLHRFDYLEHEVEKTLFTYLVVEGKDELNTAMSKTVGLPV
jgi:saccharopine dehydrogenase-like NADP-dependent oxidoreductase